MECYSCGTKKDLLKDYRYIDSLGLQGKVIMCKRCFSLNDAEIVTREVMKNDIESKYKKGFNILMEYWDSLPDEEKQSINKRLKELGL